MPIRRARHLLAPALTSAVVVLLAGCGSTPAVTAEAAAAPPATTSASPAAAVALAPDELDVLEIGHLGRLYSVLVRNPSPTLGLRGAGFTVVAEHADGRFVRYAERVPDGTPDTCCVIELLPPGGVYGLFFDIGDDAQDIVEVTVSVDPEQFVTPEPSLPTYRATAGEPGPRQEGDRVVTVVDVSVRSSTPLSTATNTVVQPVLEDGRGRLVAVIGARVRCVPAGADPRSVSLALPLEAPGDVRVREVLVYPAPTDPTLC